MMETRRVVLRCGGCRAERPFILNLGQIRALVGGAPLRQHCAFCGSARNWTPTEALDLADLSAPRRGQKKNILVVDDDDLVLKLLQKVLDSSEAQIEVTTSGKEALAKLASQKFDLLICDIHMPEMSGQDLYRHIQQTALLPPERIIFLTGDKRPEVKAFLDTTGSHCLYKPIQFLEFSEHVYAVLSGETGD
jgi:CheY-like chemotaxis protein